MSSLASAYELTVTTLNLGCCIPLGLNHVLVSGGPPL
jgi:hypothetical protein